MKRLLLVAGLVCLAACQVRSEVNLTVAEDGSGFVEVRVGLDDDAIERVPSPDSLFVTDDLAAAGWTVGEPRREEDGFTWVTAAKDFGNLGEAESVLAEVSGDSGLVTDLDLVRDDGITATGYHFEATLDLSGGLASFSDEELTATLDGQPVGEPVEAIEERFGGPIEEMFVLDVTVELPGDGSGKSTLRPGEPSHRLVVDGEVVDRAPLIWLAVAAVAASAALVVMVRRIAHWRGRRPSKSGASKPDVTPPA